MEYLGTEKPVNKIQPLVSVCITTYNHREFIAECLESVLIQKTDFPFEIIVGEDDSTDGTREICKAYAEKHPDKIRLFLRKSKDKIYIDGHKTGRFNFIAGIKAARGKYIALCDGDDFWLTDIKLQLQKNTIEEDPNASLVFSGWNSKQKDFDSSNVKLSRHNKKGEFDNSIAHTSSLFFKHVLHEIPICFYEVYALDRRLFSHILDYGHAIQIRPFLSYYRLHQGGVWTGFTEKMKTKRRIYDLKVLLRHKKISFYYFFTRSISLKYPIVKEKERQLKVALKHLIRPLFKW